MCFSVSFVFFEILQLNVKFPFYIAHITNMCLFVFLIVVIYLIYVLDFCCQVLFLCK